MMNKQMAADAAVARIRDGDSIMIGGFGLRGCPNTLVDALVASGKKDLTIISNDLGSPGVGLGRLLTNHQVRKLIGTYYNWNPEAVDAYNRGEINVEIVPQGTFAESIRAAGMGIPAYYTPTSAGTDLGKGKEVREFNGKLYVLERAIRTDVALIKAHRADPLGNLAYSCTARNFNPLMAMAATYTIAEVDELSDAYLDPEAIVTPHIFVHAVVERSAE